MKELDKKARISDIDFVFQYYDGKERVLSVAQQVCQEIFGIDRYPEIYQKAAALLYFLILDHFMVDGNKRFSMVLTELFLKKNGYIWRLPLEEYISMATTIADRNKRPTLEEVQKLMEKKIYKKKVVKNS